MFPDKPGGSLLTSTGKLFPFQRSNLENWSVIMIPSPPLRSARKRAATVWEIGERKDTKDGMERGGERGEIMMGQGGRGGEGLINQPV